MKNPMKLVLKSEKIRVPSRRPATSERHRGQLRATWFQLVNLWKKTASSHQHSPTIWSGWCYQLRSFWGLRTETKKKGNFEMVETTRAWRCPFVFVRFRSPFQVFWRLHPATQASLVKDVATGSLHNDLRHATECREFWKDGDGKDGSYPVT
jgi:hypothetical protein